MNEQSGWLIDLYADAQGLALWLLCDDGQRLPLRMDFPVTFYAAGERSHLRGAWRFLQEKHIILAREQRRDLFSGTLDVLAATVPHPLDVPLLVRELMSHFETLDLYDADVPLPLRFAARTGVGLLGRCRAAYLGNPEVHRGNPEVHRGNPEVHRGNRLQRLEPLESPWELEPLPIPLRILQLSPDCDPASAAPRSVKVSYDRNAYSIDLQPERAFEVALQSAFQRCDPDLVLTDYGDTWLIPLLKFNPNRDPTREVQTRKESSYFAYGQVIFRGAQCHLYGRWHIDRKNATLFNEYGLEGVLEQARVTGLGVQDMARKSPGAGITAMQMLTALRTGVLVPLVKQQAESLKSLEELIQADKGGMIYQPLVGLHANVAQIDFASMYPSIMVNCNISPETKVEMPRQDGSPVPRAQRGLVPQTLRPLLEKRLALKHKQVHLHPRDCRVRTLKARSAALKWLLVVCFGYLGYKNARFGRIEAHEAVTTISRELLLQAKEEAEQSGFEVLHMYVDCLFVQKKGCEKAADFDELLAAIERRTGIQIALEGVYRWVAFLPSRADARVPVPNRYFGVFLDGELKYRGIELRRHDTPPWVLQTQLSVLNCLAQAPSLEAARACLPDALRLVEQARHDLLTGRVPLADLLVTLRLSRAPQEYRAPSAAARAALILQGHGHNMAAGQPRSSSGQPRSSSGQTVRFVYTRGRPGVWAYGSGELDRRTVDIPRYLRLMERAVESVLGIFGWHPADSGQLPLPHIGHRLTLNHLENTPPSA